MKKLTQEQLDERLYQHELFLEDENTGKRLDISNCDVSGLDMSNSIMRYAIMRNADMSNVNMRNAIIDNISMFNTIGNSVNIITQQLGKYMVNYTHDRLQIACKNYSIEDWFKFSDDEIASMAEGALDWWNKYKDFIKKSIELKPALKTRR